MTGHQCYLIRWSLATHNCEIIIKFNDLRFDNATVFGATYASSDGFLYGSENTLGNIYKVSIQTPYSIVKFADGPASYSNDGARCINNTQPVGNGEGNTPTYGS